MLVSLCAVTLGCPSSTYTKPFTRSPYVQLGTPSSAVIRWRTRTPTQTVAWLGTSVGNLTQVWSDPVAKTGHEVPVTGLTADTEYFYAVGDDLGILLGGDPDHRFTTSPMPGVAVPTRIWVIGDYGFANSGARAVRDAYLAYTAGRDTDVWLTLGDNAYEDGRVFEFQNGLFNTYPTLLRNTFLWPSFGNHDGRSADSDTESGPYYEVFTLPRQGEAGGMPSGTEAYYSFDYGNIHFISMDSYESDRSPTGPMMTWLAADLASTTADWIIAYWHHPPYSRGSHNSDAETRMVEMREVAVPILEAGGADLVLTGHSHVYERSFLLDGHYGTSTTFDMSMAVDGGDGRELGDGAYVKPGINSHEGTVYAVAGSSGRVNSGRLDHPAMFAAHATLGSMVIDIDGNRLDARFLDYSGNILDEFTMLKGMTPSLKRDVPRVSLASGGTQAFFMDAGATHANKEYLLFGSLDTSPGQKAGAVHLPLNADAWWGTSLLAINSAVYPNTRGRLDDRGRAQAAIAVPAVMDPALLGRAFHHAFVVFEGQSFFMASNPVKLTLGY